MRERAREREREKEVWERRYKEKKIHEFECRPWTPPSTMAEFVLFSTLSSPLYIMDLRTWRR